MYGFPSADGGNAMTYTVTVGLIPILVRIIIHLCISSQFQGKVDLFSIPDLIVFGLVLHISSINEIEHYQQDSIWKTIQNGISIHLIIIYSILLAITLLHDTNLSNININIDIVRNCSGILDFISFLLSYSIYDRLSNESNSGLSK